LEESKKKLIHLAMEFFPLFKRGGLGDYCYSLVNALSENFDNEVYLPYCQDFLKNEETAKLLEKVSSYELSFLGVVDEVEVFQYLHPEVSSMVYVLKSKNFAFDDVTQDAYIISNPLFLYLHYTKSVLTYINKASQNSATLLLHDWQTFGCFFYPDLLSQNNRTTVGLIHNYEYQGDISRGDLESLNGEISLDLNSLTGREAYSLLTLMLEKSDHVLTVSPTYANEITHFKLAHPRLKEAAARGDILGFINGIDEKIWSPTSDPLISAHFNFENLFVKQSLKSDCLSKYFPGSQDSELLVSFISRFCPQKGIDLFFQDDFALFRYIEEHKINVLFISVIDPFIKGQILAALEVAKKITTRFCFVGKYTEKSAHEAFASSDVLLMPSSYEPCGLSQLYALQYGTLPIVSPRGGLKDTVQNFHNGFVMKDYSTESLLESMESARSTFASDKKKWLSMQSNAMNEDKSWEARIKPYVSFLKSINTF
jgi:starch synthase